MSYNQSILTIAVISVITYLIRSFPFIVFRNKGRDNKVINYLANVLPYSLIAMLLIYCFKDVKVFEYSYGLPEVIACMLVIVFHKYKHNMLLSILGSTIIYMLLVQKVFIKLFLHLFRLYLELFLNYCFRFQLSKNRYRLFQQLFQKNFFRLLNI